MALVNVATLKCPIIFNQSLIFFGTILKNYCVRSQILGLKGCVCQVLSGAEREQRDSRSAHYSHKGQHFNQVLTKDQFAILERE